MRGGRRCAAIYKLQSIQKLLLNSFSKVFSKVQKTHWACCYTDLWWNDEYRPCVSWAESTLCHVYHIYVSNILWQLVLCHNHKQTHQRAGISHKDTLHIQLFILCWRKCIFLFSYLCTQGNLSVISDGNKLIGEPKLEQKKQKSIPCR